MARLVSYATEKGQSFGQLSLAEYKKFSSRFEDDVYSVTVESAIAARDIVGGTAFSQVERALATAKEVIGDFKGER